MVFPKVYHLGRLAGLQRFHQFIFVVAVVALSWFAMMAALKTKI